MFGRSVSVGAQRFSLHQLLARYAIYSLILSTVVSIGLLASRFYVASSGDYRFLIWNLFLAWIPYGCAVWVLWLQKSSPGPIWQLAGPAFLWLIFLPNAPYIVTDFVHLEKIPRLAGWYYYDLGLLATFAWTGCFLGVVSLQMMQHVVSKWFGPVASWMFVLVVAGLTGIGIYLGRFLRFNSWDLFIKPGKIIGYVLRVAIDPFARQHQQAIGITLMFSALVLVCYVTFTTGRQQSTHLSESAAP
jgi:uncharacterized membrane protein